MSRRAIFHGAVLIAIAGCIAATASPPAVSQPASGCRATDAVVVPRHLLYFRDLLTSTDSERVSVREHFGLPAASANKVNLVTKAATCVNAANALNTHRGEAGTDRFVWVYTLGTNAFAVEDPSIPAGQGEYTPIYIFSKTWTYKVTIAGM